MLSGKPRLFFYFAITLLLVGAAWILASRLPPGATTQGKIPAPRQDFLAPDFELTTSTGETVRLSDLRGKPLIAQFLGELVRALPLRDASHAARLPGV